MTTSPSPQSPSRPSKYRLPPEQAANIRTNPPFNMTVMEAAAYLAVSPRKVRDLVASRRLRHARIGAKIVIRREYLDELITAP